MSSDDGPNRYEIAGRYDKAQRLARCLRRVGVDHLTAASWTSDQWEVAASMAKLKNPPSETTRGLVLGLLTPVPVLRKGEQG